MSGKIYDRDDDAHTPIEGAFIRLYSDSSVSFCLDSTSVSNPFVLLLEQEKKYILSASHLGFDSANVSLSTMGLLRSDTLLADIFLERNPKPFNPSMKIEEEKTYTLRNILYDYDKASLRKQSKVELDRLIVLLQKMPDAIIELSSHTDSCGSEEYNMKLSQRRAESAVHYLIENGISSSRLLAKGYGETKFVAPNSKADGSDNPEGRQLNRRTDFKIIGDLKNTKLKYE